MPFKEDDLNDIAESGNMGKVRKEVKIGSGVTNTFATWDNIEFSYDKIELQSRDETKSPMAGGLGLSSGL